MSRRRVLILGNPNSIHLRQWLLAMADCGIAAEIWHAERSIDQEAVHSSRRLAPLWPVPKAVRYAQAGLMARLFKVKKNDAIVHAHSASGYGLMARMLGLEYIVSIYGTEFNGLHKKGMMFRRTVIRNISTASRILTTSQSMAKQISTDFPELASKTNVLSWGVDTTVFRPGASVMSSNLRFGDVDITQLERPIFFVNRRITSHYKTLELVSGFESYRNEGGKGTLLLLRGDADSNYLNEVSARSTQSSNCIVLNSFLSAHDMAAVLDYSDAFISVPLSDSLSSAVLEGLAVGRTAVLSAIPAYRELHAAEVDSIELPNFEAEVVSNMFFKVAQSAGGRSDKNSKIVELNYSRQETLTAIKRLYEGLGVRV